MSVAGPAIDYWSFLEREILVLRKGEVVSVSTHDSALFLALFQLSSNTKIVPRSSCVPSGGQSPLLLFTILVGDVAIADVLVTY